MPARKMPAAMTPAEFRAIIAAAGLADAKKSAVAAAIGCGRSHVYRWLSGETNINAGNALLIRAKLPPKTPKPKSNRKKK